MSLRERQEVQEVLRPLNRFAHKSGNAVSEPDQPFALAADSANFPNTDTELPEPIRELLPFVAAHAISADVGFVVTPRFLENCLCCNGDGEVGVKCCIPIVSEIGCSHEARAAYDRLHVGRVSLLPAQR